MSTLFSWFAVIGAGTVILVIGIIVEMIADWLHDEWAVRRWEKRRRRDHTRREAGG